MEQEQQPPTKAELLQMGHESIVSATTTVVAAVQDIEQCQALIDHLVEFTNKPRSANDADNEIGPDLVELISAAYAVLEGADLYDTEQESQRQMATWLRTVAKTCIHLAAERLSHTAARACKTAPPRVLH